MKNKNYSLEFCLVILILGLLISSCGSSRYYKGCDGKKKVKMISEVVQNMPPRIPDGKPRVSVGTPSTAAGSPTENKRFAMDDLDIISELSFEC